MALADDVLNLWRGGMNTADIARQVFIPESDVAAFVSNGDRERVVRRGPYSLEESRLARTLFDRGVNVYEAAKEIGRTPQGIADYARRHFASNRWFIDLERMTPELRAARAQERAERSADTNRTAPLAELPDLAAKIKITDTYQNCIAEMRTISFLGTDDQIPEPQCPPNYRHVSRTIAKRQFHGGGFAKWVEA